LLAPWLAACKLPARRLAAEAELRKLEWLFADPALQPLPSVPFAAPSTVRGPSRVRPELIHAGNDRGPRITRAINICSGRVRVRIAPIDSRRSAEMQHSHIYYLASPGKHLQHNSNVIKTRVASAHQGTDEDGVRAASPFRPSVRDLRKPHDDGVVLVGWRTTVVI